MEVKKNEKMEKEKTTEKTKRIFLFATYVS